MKTTILKVIIPPFLFFILYLNLNFFVFSFDARQSYLNKRLNKAVKDKEELKKEIQTLSKDKLIKQHEELNRSLKDLETMMANSENLPRTKVNIYKEFEDNNLKLISEQLIKSGATKKNEFKQVTNFTLTGDYQDVIRTLKAISESELIPVNFSLLASEKDKTKYTISVWNKNEQF